MKWLFALKEVLAAAQQVVDSMPNQEDAELDPTLASKLALLNEHHLGDLRQAMAEFDALGPRTTPAWFKRRFGQIAISITNDFGSLETVGDDSLGKDGMRQAYLGQEVAEYVAYSETHGVRCEIKVTRNLNGKLERWDEDSPRMQEFDRYAEWIEKYGDPEQYYQQGRARKEPAPTEEPTDGA